MSGSEVLALEPERKKRVLLNARLTDLGNGERLVEMHGDALRYVPTSKKWHCWDGRRWVVDDLLDVQRRAKETVRAVGKLAFEMEYGADRIQRLKFAQDSESNGKLKAMIERAAAEPGIAVLPESFDAHPFLLNVANGVVDLSTGELGPHDRNLLMTKLVPVEYPGRDDAECPLWLAFLDRVFAGDQVMISYVQRAIGYTLTGDTREQCLHLLYGTGANGKSTFQEIIADITGDYSLQADFSTFLEKKHNDGPRNEIAALKGARYVRSSEIGEGKRFNEALIKTLTGGEKMRARFLYAEEFEFTPAFKLWFSFNHKPLIRGTDHAIWRRVRLIPFAVTIPDSEKDDMLKAKLRVELPGILRWAVDGCLAWHREGLRPPDSVLAATAAYRAESDTLGAFIEECCELGTKLEEAAAPLYKAYKKWAHDGGEFEMSQTAFGRKLSDRGFDVDTSRRHKYRRGLSLKAEFQPQDEQTHF